MWGQGGLGLFLYIFWLYFLEGAIHRMYTNRNDLEGEGAINDAGERRKGNVGAKPSWE